MHVTDAMIACVDIFACMQATSAPAVAASEPVGGEALSRDMYALVSYLMRAASVRTFNAIAELDLSFSQIKVLCALEADGEERSVKALAESMGLSLPAMSRAVDGLF